MALIILRRFSLTPWKQHLHKPPRSAGCCLQVFVDWEPFCSSQRCSHHELRGAWHRDTALRAPAFPPAALSLGWGRGSSPGALMATNK